MCKSYDKISHLRGYDGIGRHARFRFWWETVQVQALLPAPRQNNTIRSSAAASGVRSTDGVVFPFQTEPAALGFDLVLGASFMCWHLYCYAITRRSKLCIACSDFLKNPSALTMPSRRYQLFAGSSPYQIIQMHLFRYLLTRRCGRYVVRSGFFRHHSLWLSRKSIRAAIFPAGAEFQG